VSEEAMNLTEYQSVEMNNTLSKKDRRTQREVKQNSALLVWLC